MNITLNLLPEEQKKRLQKKRIFGFVLQQELYVVFLLFFVVAVLGSINIILSSQLQSIKDATTQEELQDRYRKLQHFEEFFRDVNVQTGIVSDVEKKHLSLSRALFLINDLKRDGVEFDAITINEGAAIIKGFAQSRDQLARHIDDLKKSVRDGHACFGDVKTAEDDLFKKEDFNFTITLTLNSACLTQ